MSLHFHPLAVKDIKKETADCVSIQLEVPENLAEQFRFVQGQSLTLRARINGEEVRRNYSICSSPLDGELRVAIKQIEGGKFSTYANQTLQKGDVVDVMPPVGKFYTELRPDQQKNYVAFAAGSGITPIISIIKTSLLTESRSTFCLVYGNKTSNDIIFKEELEALKNKFLGRFRLIHVLSRERTDAPVNSGRINSEKCEMLFSKLIPLSENSEFFLCGPEEMIFCVNDYLEARGIDKKRIHFELFTSTGSNTRAKKTTTTPIAEGAQSRISIILDGRETEFTMPLNGETTLLDAALQKGADLPFACKGGMCCTCKAKLIEGKVDMEVHWGLEEDELENGFILTCQSHPTTEKVVIDFDVK